MPRITWFEYFTEDAEKDLAFYKAAFGWESQKWGDMPYWLVMTGDKGEPGIDGAIGFPPMEGMTQKVINTISVDDNDAFTAKALAAGGTVVVPKRAVPGSGWLTYIADPAGIVFGIMQYDGAAK
jgi:predicted enzyme related to lactoylglutathione lyase